MNRPEVVIIVARAENGVIGVDGRLPWHIPSDLRRFKQLTMGAPMIMGRKTFESLPGLLPDRRHIVLTREQAWGEDGVELANSVEDALRLANAPRVSIIGGAEIYRLFLPRADRIELTEGALEPAGDTVLEPVCPGWQEIRRESQAAQGAAPAFALVNLKRGR